MAPHSELRPQREYRSLADARAAWSHALDDEGAPLFARLQWFELLGRHCYAQARLVIASAVQPDAAGDHVALLPLVEAGDRLESFANWYSFSFAPIFSTRDLDLRAALMNRIARDLRGKTGHISLFPVLDEEGTADVLVQSFHRAGWVAIKRDMAHNHILRLHGRNFATYWAARGGNLRRRVKRKGKAAGLTFSVHSDWSEALWTDYEAVYAASWKPCETHPALLRDIAQDAAARGALRLAFARDAQGRAIATQFWTIEGGTALIHKMAHDSHHDAISPGTLLAHFLFAHVIDNDGVAMIDYGTGDNAYKREWMEEERPMWRIDCFDPFAPRQWPSLARTLISRLAGRRKGG